MKLLMKASESMRILSKTETPWEMNGRSGISYKVGVRVNGDIDKVKVTKEVYEQLALDKDYFLFGELNVSNGNSNFMFVGIDSDSYASVKPGTGKDATGK